MLYDDLVERIFGQDISYSFEYGMMQIVGQEIDECDFEGIDLHIEIHFTKCTFLESVSFENLKRIEVKQCIFERDVNFSSIPEICFSECVFNDIVNVCKSSCLHWSFGKNIFRCGFWFEQTVGERISFCQNTIDEFLFWNQNQFDKMIINQNKIHNLHIQESIFNALEMDFNEIEKANFLLSTFKKSTEIVNSNFQIINFQDTKFLSFLILDGSKFEKFFNFTNIQCVEFPNISKAFFVGKIQISEQTFFCPFVELAKKREFHSDLRKCFQTLKDNHIKQNNLLDSSDYLRMELYCKELELNSKPDKTTREWIDWFQLFFYRHTSDHHTDILKSLNSLVALIGIFGFLCGAVVWGLDYFAFDYREGINVLKLKEIYSSHIMTSIEEHTSDYLLGNFVLALVFIGLFLGVVWEHSRTLLIILGYGVISMFFIISPKYLVPAMSLFDSKKALLDPICTLGGLYTLLFGFLAYSFIKTIRKNSIIPS